MIRTALRLSTVAALVRGGAPLQFPTVAGPACFDSRNDDVLDVSPEERRPVIIVRTDRDNRSRLTRGGQPTGGTTDRTIEVRIEISVLVGIQDDQGNVVPGWPIHDAGLEAMLDLLEYQVEMALFSKAPWALWWQEFWQPEGFESGPILLGPEQGNVRVAAREILVRVKAAADCAPNPVKQGELLNPGRLDPRLVAVFDKVAADGGGDLKISFADMRAKLLVQYLPDGGAHPLLTGVRMTIIPRPSGYGSNSPVPIEAELQADPLPSPPP